MCIGVAVSIATLRDVHKRPALRQVLRMLPEPVQRDIYDDKQQSEAVRWTTKLYCHGCPPGVCMERRIVLPHWIDEKLPDLVRYNDRC